jgi:hypothetical protein
MSRVLSTIAHSTPAFPGVLGHSAISYDYRSKSQPADSTLNLHRCGARFSVQWRALTRHLRRTARPWAEAHEDRLFPVFLVRGAPGDKPGAVHGAAHCDWMCRSLR